MKLTICCAAFQTLSAPNDTRLLSGMLGAYQRFIPNKKTAKSRKLRINRRVNMKLGNHLLKAAMLSTISIASLSAGSVAYAQDNTPQASDEVDENVIIVTATKREQTLQEVPVAVTVTTAETKKILFHSTCRNQTHVGSPPV